MAEVIFMTGDQLPLVHKAVINITTYAPEDKPTWETKKGTTILYAYSEADRLKDTGLWNRKCPNKTE